MQNIDYATIGQNKAPKQKGSGDGKRNRFFGWIGGVVARANDPSSGFMVKALAVGATGIVIAVVSWAIIDGIQNDRDHSMRISALESSYAATLSEINRRLALVEQEIRNNGR